MLPAHMLCCMLMKFPLFPIRCTLSPQPPRPAAFFSAPHLFVCPFGPVSTIDTILLLTSASCLQQNFKIEDEEDLRHDFERLQQAMEMVGFLPATKKQ